MPVPSPDRAGPGVLVQSDGVALQFDAGRATAMRLAALGVSPVDLDGVFVTHHHSDHVSGLEDLVMSRWIMDRLDEAPTLPIVGPEGPATDFLTRMMDPWEHDLEVRSEHTARGTHPGYEVRPFQVGGGLIEVWSQGRVRVMAGPVRHEPVTPAVGYRIETPDGRGGHQRRHPGVPGDGGAGRGRRRAGLRGDALRPDPGTAGPPALRARLSRRHFADWRPGART